MAQKTCRTVAPNTSHVLDTNGWEVSFSKMDRKKSSLILPAMPSLFHHPLRCAELSLPALRVLADERGDDLDDLLLLAAREL